ncbi:MAG TPA: hypothetical protein VNH22_06670, partial [Blastocatellia bacterium]|nr:hypothetical protein [Blastocatellia bacterium]
VVLAGLAERAVTGIRMGRVIGVKRSDLGLLKDVGKMALAAAAAGLVTIAARVLLPHARPFITLIA